ncbi:hypothetical protein DFP72DRAFT_850117 [Ephemerocybe angulata]|uniref:Uncharacterized protein n=1 Tax=Ephemerocybe angulata TaxID=980116 RepID=A0A8H6M5N4_9AGAR|nr:hypothetical protein DFP72DRAFT_850117 [Tulosesus angulatus]
MAPRHSHISGYTENCIAISLAIKSEYKYIDHETARKRSRCARDNRKAGKGYMGKGGSQRRRIGAEWTYMAKNGRISTDWARSVALSPALSRPGAGMDQVTLQGPSARSREVSARLHGPSGNLFVLSDTPVQSIYGPGFLFGESEQGATGYETLEVASQQDASSDSGLTEAGDSDLTTGHALDSDLHRRQEDPDSDRTPIPVQSISTQEDSTLLSAASFPPPTPTPIRMMPTTLNVPGSTLTDDSPERLESMAAYLLVQSETLLTLAFQQHAKTIEFVRLVRNASQRAAMARSSASRSFLLASLD